MFSSRRSYGNQKQLFHTEVLIPEEGFLGDQLINPKTLPARTVTLEDDLQNLNQPGLCGAARKPNGKWAEGRTRIECLLCATVHGPAR
jgi:hypothetical protein